MASEHLRRQWREAQRRRRLRIAAGLSPLQRGWSSLGKAHAPPPSHPWQRDKVLAHEDKLAKLRAALAEEDWDLPTPGAENERYSRMSIEELCAELNLHAQIDAGGDVE